MLFVIENGTCTSHLSFFIHSKWMKKKFLRTFGRLGPIASVKMMWRSTEAKKLCLCYFHNRTDGQAAKDETQGLILLAKIENNQENKYFFSLSKC